MPREHEMSREEKLENLTLEIEAIMSKTSLQQANDIRNACLEAIKDNKGHEDFWNGSAWYEDAFEKGAGALVTTVEQLYLYHQAMQEVALKYHAMIRPSIAHDKTERQEKGPEVIKIPSGFRRARLSNQEVAGVQFDASGMVVYKDDEMSPFAPDQKLSIVREEGVGGHVENVQAYCAQSGFRQSQYDGLLYLPKKFLDEHMKVV